MPLRPSRVFPALALWLCGTAFAAEDSTIIHPGAAAGPVAPAVASANGSSATAMTIALVLLGGGAWALWRAKKNPRFTREAGLGIKETRSLGGRQYLVVAAYENRKFLIGVSPGNINLISSLDSDERKGTAP